VPLPARQTDTSVNVDEVLNVFRGPQRAALRTFLDGFGNGMRGRGASLRRAFVELVPFLDVAGRLSKELADQRPQLRHLVHNARLLAAELGRRQRMLRELVGSGSRTLTALEDGRGDLDATLAELAPTLRAVDVGLASVRGILDDVDPALQATKPVADALPRSLSALRRLSATAEPALRALRRPVRDLVPLARSLRPVAGEARDAFDLLRPQVPTVNKVTRGLVRCKRGLQGFFQWDASLTKFGDVLGAFPRGNLVLGAQSTGVTSAPDEARPVACDGRRAISGRVPVPSDFH
jgi:ABC-type transporter Mla subunit MlaD